MKNKYLAKTEKEKTIKEHTQDLLDQYAILKKIYPMILKEEEWDLLKYAVEYHDLGKMNTKFQNKIYKALGYQEEELLEDNVEGQEVPHNFLSPLFINTKIFAEKIGAENTMILFSSVYYHHDRKWIEYDKDQIKQDLLKQLSDFGDFYDLQLGEIKSSRRYLLKEDDIEDIRILESKRYIMIKGLLHKLDYVASLDKQGVNIEEEIELEGRNVAQKIQLLVEEKYKNNYRPVQQYMLENQENNLVIVSPTGSGKTEACLLWIGNSKAFYTLPLKVSINAIYERIIGPIGYSKALLLHSDAYSYYEENGKTNQEWNLYDRARRLSSPLIVTTVDQLFKIAFKYKGYEEILATLSYSKVIIDEIQMYSPQLLAYILLGLKMIHKVGGKFAIVTATFPPILYDLMDELNIPYQRTDSSFPATIEKRHKIQVLNQEELEIEQIKEQAKNKKVLVIVNTVKKAQQLYAKLEGDNVFVLHSHFLKADRSKLEKKILDFSDRDRNQENGIWIATQIVEASLDIDFDILHTEMCSIDSLFQRMGRVYRKREYTEKEPNVYIYHTKNGRGYIIDKEIYDYSFQEISKYSGKLISEQDKQNMIENIFDSHKNPDILTSNYYSSIKNKIDLLRLAMPNQLEKAKIQELFREIQSIMIIPDNVYDSLHALGKIEEWISVFRKKSSIHEKMKAKNEIACYTIALTKRWNLQYDKEELFYFGSNIHRSSYSYDFDQETEKGIGLIMQGEEERFF